MDDEVPYILEPLDDDKAARKDWARLIQKIYEVNPLVCPKCQGTMKIISSIEDPSVIRAILEHPGLWLVRSRPPPKVHAPPTANDLMDDFSSQPIHDDYLSGHPQYSRDDYIQS